MDHVAGLTHRRVLFVGILAFVFAWLPSSSTVTANPIYSYDSACNSYDVASRMSTAHADERVQDGVSPSRTVVKVAFEGSASSNDFVVAAKAAPKGADKIAVIGRQWDTAVAKDWPGHKVLDIPDWSLAKNDAWVGGVIQRGEKVYIGSPETKANLWDVVNNRSTVFGRELSQFSEAGYTRSGNYLLP